MAKTMAKTPPMRFTSVKRSLIPKGPMFLRIFEAEDYQVSPTEGARRRGAS